MTALPANIRRDDAPLPERYEQARSALAECHDVDECKDWADKAQALASYARQADDDTLHKLAVRIQARAIRRAGELLQTFNNGVGRPAENGEGARPITQRAAADAAGMSRHQEKTAVRVANVPDGDFESAVESDDPPTVTKLADMGRTPRPGFAKATHLLGAVDRFATFCRDNTAEEVARGVMESEASELRSHATTIAGWLGRLVDNLEDAA